MTPRDLWNMIGMPDIDDTDMAWVQANEFQIVPEDRGMAEQVIVTTQFRNWLNKAGSAKLLVHGNFDFAREISPFSILCVSITWLFRQWTSRGIISLVFFCRRHTERNRGGRAMIRSLICQLLRQFPF
ncbi:hypothetical protein IMZ48_42620, partial [Candidatus Bathyarchaeota archaeon]|nr:hypothetical protein [Candidatus Bathyarchaeota archaeon]